MSTSADPQARALRAYVGTYTSEGVSDSGGIYSVDVARDGQSMTTVDRSGQPAEAGYLLYSASSRTLFAVDERKTDGRGSVRPPAAVHALRADDTGGLKWLSSAPAFGPFPTYLDHDEASGWLVAVSHGGFDHTEQVARTEDGAWETRFVYDDSAVLLYRVGADGIPELADVHVLTGHGLDPNDSPQAGGHAQASSHGHCAVIDPSRRYVLVADKGTDQVHVFALEAPLRLLHTLQLPPQTGPRHLAFDPASRLAYLTCEFSSELASISLDATTGTLTLLERVSTLESPCFNEPADVRVHPSGGLVYVNNRGEDSLAWFKADAAGGMTRIGHVALAPSAHPGVAARSFAFDPSGQFLLVADRPADLVRSYAIDLASGALTPLCEHNVPQPAFIAFAEGPHV